MQHQAQTLVSDTDAVVARVVAVMAQMDPHASFDYARLARSICEGKFVDGIGRCQSGKTGYVVVAVLTAFMLGRACFIILAHSVKNSRELASKVNANHAAEGLPTARCARPAAAGAGRGPGGAAAPARF